ncbi:conserved hypothetical protein [Leishmania infantum JPCM5]|uniref:Uncharacterized protein n=2 Tax=Leishmania infantum TaxID=5671 RepID=A4IBH5_LEIIN|nr:conserved hypothetical protein [Leishmania infantum JPCM5]CAC9545364.1 protein_kinase_-_putative [Leishmania infantum]CAM72194.1 conserved hypothetical protein [Leishmania infantum JPCM5]SUZ46117.1 protein_kinase_-_putative [Leishmania infantum]|eukprot:XP_001469094.1 conserved hypothetical protein [Leishmania infantum JPCM5]
MSAVLVDTRGHEYRLEMAVDPERGSYGALFQQATTYRAQRILPPCTGDIPGLVEDNASGACAKSLASAALVTYIPLTTSLQESDITPEAASLHLVLQNIRLRRQVDHPYLRTLIDAFYMNQVPSSPSSTSGGVSSVVVTQGPGASPANPSPPRQNLVKQTGTAEDSGGTNWPAGAAVPALASSSAITALVVVEEYIEGCSLADYADAVAQRHLKQGNLQIQNDAAAIACQLAQVLLHLHAVGHVLCRDLPLDCVHMDINKGCVQVRLPLSAASMLDLVEGSASSAPAAVMASPRTTSIGESTSNAFGEGKCFVGAPEMSEMSDWNEISSAPCGAVPLYADVWALGLLMLQLCSLNHKNLSGATNATERLLVIRSRLPQPAALLPADTEEGMTELIRSCLECSPTKRPTLSMLLKSSAFAKHRSFTMREPNRAVISLAEAVKAIRRHGRTSASMQPAAPHSRTMSTIDADLPNKIVDDSLISLSLQNLHWTTPPSFRDVFAPLLVSPPETADPCEVPVGIASHDPTAAATTQSRQRPPPSLAAATKQALHDVALLRDRYRDICVMATQTSAPATTSAQKSAYAALWDRVQNTRQLPRDITTTTAIMGELTEHLAKLEQNDPKLCFRFMELLLEGFATCPSDIASVADSVALADTLFRASAADTAATGGAQPVRMEAPLEQATRRSVPEEKEAVFNVAETLRVMPSMPAHMISSERAANTSSVLYNSWLRKQRKKHLKMDEY